MKKAYLKCLKKEGEEFEDEYVVRIDLLNGSVSSGKVRKEHLSKNGNLKVTVIEDYGEKALVILPKRLGKAETALVSTDNLYTY